MMHKLTCSLLICLMTAGLLPAKAHAAPTTLYDGFMQRIKDAVVKVPSTVEESNVALFNSKIADLKTLVTDTQSTLKKIMLDITSASLNNELPADELFTLGEYFNVAVVVVDNFQKIVNGAEGSITDNVNKLSSLGQQFATDMNRVLNEHQEVYDLGYNDSWEDWYVWLWFDGGFEYYVSLKDEKVQVMNELAFMKDVEQNLNVFDPDDYIMALSGYYNNKSQGVGVSYQIASLENTIDGWIPLGDVWSNALQYWASQGVQAWVDGTYASGGAIYLYYYDWVLLGAPGNFRLAWACIYSTDLGQTWWYSFQ